MFFRLACQLAKHKLLQLTREKFSKQPELANKLCQQRMLPLRTNNRADTLVASADTSNQSVTLSHLMRLQFNPTDPHTAPQAMVSHPTLPQFRATVPLLTPLQFRATVALLTSLQFRATEPHPTLLQFRATAPRRMSHQSPQAIVLARTSHQ